MTLGIYMPAERHKEALLASVTHLGGRLTQDQPPPREAVGVEEG